MTPGTSFVVFMQLVGLIMLLVATVISIFIQSTTFKQKCWLGALSVLGFGANITGLIFDKIGADNDQIALISRADSTLRKADLTIQKSDSTMGLLMGIKTDAEEISETVDSVGNIQTRLQSTSQNLVDFNIVVQDQRREQNANELLTAVIELGQNRFYVHAMQNQPLPDSSILIQVIYNVLDEQYKTLKSEWSNPILQQNPYMRTSWMFAMHHAQFLLNSYRTQVGIPIKGYFEMVNEYLVDSETRIGGYFKATFGVVYPPKFQRKGSEKVLAFLKDQPNGDLKNAPKELLDPSLYP